MNAAIQTPAPMPAPADVPASGTVVTARGLRKAYRNKLAHTWRPGGNNNPIQRLAITLMMQPTTHDVFAQVEAEKDTRLSQVEDAIRSIFVARGAASPAVEEMLLRATLEGVTVKLVSMVCAIAA